MKRIRLSIQDIHLKGRDPDILSDLIFDIDKQLQAMCENAEDIRGFLIKFSSNSDGEQLSKAIGATSELCKNLNEACETIYDVQVQVVDYQNKVYQFEGIGRTASAPKRLLPIDLRISIDHSQVNYTLSDVKNLADRIAAYCDNSYANLRGIEEARDKIASVWMDSQFKDFSDIIDDVILSMKPHFDALEDYIAYLDKKISKLGE